MTDLAGGRLTRRDWLVSGCLHALVATVLLALWQPSTSEFAPEVEHLEMPISWQEEAAPAAPPSAPPQSRMAPLSSAQPPAAPTPPVQAPVLTSPQPPRPFAPPLPDTAPVSQSPVQSGVKAKAAHPSADITAQGSFHSATSTAASASGMAAAGKNAGSTSTAGDSSTGTKVADAAAADWKTAFLAAMARYKTYPRSAQILQQEGRVVLKVEVDGQGRLQGLAVAKSSGIGVLDEAALSCARKSAAALEGKAPPGRSISFNVPVSFRLSAEDY